VYVNLKAALPRQVLCDVEVRHPMFSICPTAYGWYQPPSPRSFGDLSVPLLLTPVPNVLIGCASGVFHPASPKPT